MPRKSEPRWYDQFGCYTFNYRGTRHYLRGIDRDDKLGLYKEVEKIRAAADAAKAAEGTLTVRKLASLYLVALRQAGMKDRTIEGHEEILRKFRDFRHKGVAYGDRPARTIAASDLGRMDRAWREAGHAPGYRAHLYASVLACWNWASRPEPDRNPERLIEENPFAGMRRPSTKGRLARIATRDDLARFLRYARADLNRPWPAGTRGRCMACMRDGRPGPCRRSHAPTLRMLRDTLVLLRLVGETGCRPGEACAALWEDWRPHVGADDRGHSWGILEVEHKTIRYTGGKRKLVVPPPLVRAIERIRSREGRHETYIFTHRRGRGAEDRGQDSAAAGEPWNTTALDRRLRQWRNAAIEGGLAIRKDFTPYALRHAYYSKVAPVLGAELAGLLGGTSGAVVRKVYLHGRDEDLIRGQSQARKRPEG
jgi:integrase